MEKTVSTNYTATLIRLVGGDLCVPGDIPTS